MNTTPRTGPPTPVTRPDRRVHQEHAGAHGAALGPEQFAVEGLIAIVVYGGLAPVDLTTCYARSDVSVAAPSLHHHHNRYSAACIPTPFRCAPSSFTSSAACSNHHSTPRLAEDINTIPPRPTKQDLALLRLMVLNATGGVDVCPRSSRVEAGSRELPIPDNAGLVALARGALGV